MSRQGPFAHSPTGAREAAGGPAPVARSGAELLRDRTVGPYFATRLTSSIGIWVHNVVAAIVVFDLTGSAFMVGAVSVAQFTPQVLIAPWGGALADRRSRRIQAMVGRSTSAAAGISLGAWIAIAGVDRLSAAHVIFAALFVGVGFAVSIPALHALVPSLVGPNELSAIVALDTAPATIARAVGPAAGALLLAFAGPAWTFAIAGSTQALLAFSVWRVRVRTVDRSDASDKSLLAGFQYLRRDVGLALLLAGVVGIGLGVDPVITLTPPMADDFGGGSQLVAILVSAFGLGAVSVSPLVGRIRGRIGANRIGSVGLITLAVSMLALAASPNAAVATLSFYIGGVGMFMGVAGFTARIQDRVPEGLRGRIMALWSVAFIGSRPLAAAANGAIADRLSVDAALIVLGGVLLAIAVATRPGVVARAKAA